MEPNQETIFLRSRFGFVKMAMTTGANLVPVFAFGQSSIFGYARPGPPLFPRGTARLLSRLCADALLGPLGAAGALRRARARRRRRAHPRAARCGAVLYMPACTHAAACADRPAATASRAVAEPSNEEVAAVLERFIAEMEALFARHKAAAGHPDLKLIVL